MTATAEVLRKRGRRYGYPSCCIEEFVANCGDGRYPAIERPVPPLDYVPCSECMGALLTAVTMPGHDRAGFGATTGHGMDGVIWLDEFKALL